MEKKQETVPGAEICVILSTVPSDKSAEIARSLIDRHLVACVNMVPVRSWYRWKDEFCDDAEHLLMAKTRHEKAGEVIQAIRALHPYDVPEIITLPVISGHAPYLDWVYGETREP